MLVSPLAVHCANAFPHKHYLLHRRHRVWTWLRLCLELGGAIAVIVLMYGI